MRFDHAEAERHDNAAKSVIAARAATPNLAIFTGLACGAVCGYVDAYSLSTFGLFTSFISGNTVTAGLTVGAAHFATAVHALIPLVPFFAGAFTGTIARDVGGKDNRASAFALIAAVLGVVTIVTVSGAPGWVSIASLGFAMGVMSVAVTKVGTQSLNVSFVSGDIKTMATHVANGVMRQPLDTPMHRQDSHWLRAALLAGVWVAFLSGAIAGALSLAGLGKAALLLPTTVMLALTANEMRKRAHTPD